LNKKLEELINENLKLKQPLEGQGSRPESKNTPVRENKIDKPKQEAVPPKDKLVSSLRNPGTMIRISSRNPANANNGSRSSSIKILSRTQSSEKMLLPSQQQQQPVKPIPGLSMKRKEEKPQVEDDDDDDEISNQELEALLMKTSMQIYEIRSELRNFEFAPITERPQSARPQSSSKPKSGSQKSRPSSSQLKYANYEEKVEVDNDAGDDEEVSEDG